MSKKANARHDAKQEAKTDQGSATATAVVTLPQPQKHQRVYAVSPENGTAVVLNTLEGAEVVLVLPGERGEARTIDVRDPLTGAIVSKWVAFRDGKVAAAGGGK